ncbi:AAA family ATPase [Kitasatospora sp. NPDC088134]|uniref:AAA family ATPase n=1 Tax=Kitasatospora sp. NPDC088134 TaxID=3364071 RepID=UPI0038081618
MITQIRIDGFKSFVGFELDVRPVTVLLGVNGAGKSNLFDALRLVAGVVRKGLKETLADDQRLAARNLFHRSGAAAGQQRDELTIVVGMDVPMAEQPVSVELRLRLLRDSGHGAVLDRNGSWVQVSAAEGKAGYRIALAAVRRLGSDYLDGVSDSSPESEIAAKVYAECVGWQPYVLDPEELRQYGSPNADGPLEPSGSNIAVVIRRIEETAPDRLIRLVADLAALVPGARGIRSTVMLPRGEFDFEVEFQHTGWASPALLSDGTLRVLALLAAYWDPKRTSTLAVEEIENGMHLSQVVRLVRRLGRGEGQLLITTHSPAVLTAMRNDLSGSVVFMEQVSHVDPERGTISRITVPLPLLAPTPDSAPGTFKSPQAVERLLNSLGQGTT